MSLLRLLATIGAIALLACSPTTSVPDGAARDGGRSDGGGFDSGTSGDCGDINQSCCIGSTPCRPGTRCGADRTCCATPGGARCTAPEDCCGDFDCVGGGCCSPAGSSCRAPADCCTDLICNSAGTCETPASDCGRAGETCCPDDMCRSGLVCVGGMCTACGNDGDPCCRPPSECAEELVCMDGRCRPSGTAGCGASGMPCCSGNRCAGSLACTGGTCMEPVGGECAYTSCDECTRHYPCGWCATTNTCQSGSGAGPATGSCGDWDWLLSQCGGGTPPACGTSTTCGDCTGRSGCGWCATTSTCQAGSSTGPTGGSCSNWDWLSLDCSATGGDTCTMYASCGECTAHYPCGWCGPTGGCRSGSLSGPASGSCGTWTWYTSGCAAADPCSDATSCSSCTARPSCGWCDATSRCAMGAAGGPTTGTCSSWDWTAADCTCGALREGCGVSGDCCGSASCRRVSSSTLPMQCCGEADATCSSGPDCCGYMNCLGGTCACRDFSEGCLSDFDCCSGFCDFGLCG